LIHGSARHGDVRDARLHEFLALRRKPLASIEIKNARLRVQLHVVVAHLVGDDQEHVQQRGTDALAAPFLEHRHAADLGVLQQPAGADRRAIRSECHHVVGMLVEAIPFQIRRHPLLFHEHLGTDRPQHLLGGSPVDRLDRESGLVAHGREL